jgi:anhydro-N-acetylmuramic acid kinase
MKLPALNILGMMSGTSLDGIDAVLVRLEYDETLHWQVLARESRQYSSDLKERLHSAIKPETSDVVLLTQLHSEVGHAYAELAKEMQGKNKIDLIALSGQTVYHIPRLDAAKGWHTKSTLQLGEASFVVETCRVPVISDFRQADMAANGQGAPLVPFGDWQLYRDKDKARSIHNLGGISNLTYLPATGKSDDVFAFDTGPANCLIDEATQLHFGEPFDKDGALAAGGNIDKKVLEHLLAHPYLKLTPPKTTGREVFTLSEIAKMIDVSSLAPHDLVATLTAFTAHSVANAYQQFVLPKGLDEILFAGGGALNPVLMQQLKYLLPASVKTFEEVGWHSKDREALSFAVMGYFGFHGLANTLPLATGASHAVCAGKVSRPAMRKTK